MAWVARLSGLLTVRQTVSPWLLALGLWSLAAIVRLVFSRWLQAAPFLAFFPALVLIPLLCGWVPGAIALVSFAALAGYFFLAPSPPIAMTAGNITAELLGFVLVGGCIIALVEATTDLVNRQAMATKMQEDLFKELQHRVANNMQVIAATLQMARRGIQDSAASEVIDQAAARINAMAQLHRRLYDPSVYRQVWNRS